MDDAIRAGILTENSVPIEYREVLGHTVKERLDILIHSIISSSMNQTEIMLDGDVGTAMLGLRKFMFENLYQGSIAKVEEGKAEKVVEKLYNYFMENNEALPEDFIRHAWSGESWERIVCDYVSCMTDGYAIHTYEELFVPKAWQY